MSPRRIVRPGGTLPPSGPPLGRPGAGYEPDLAVAVGLERGADALAERAASLIGERRAIGGGGAAAGQERRPVVVEALEHGGHVDGAGIDAGEAGGLEQRVQ